MCRDLSGETASPADTQGRASRLRAQHVPRPWAWSMSREQLGWTELRARRRAVGGQAVNEKVLGPRRAAWRLAESWEARGAALGFHTE